MSASCGRVSETENGQEQGELRTAVSKATLFQPEWPCVAGEVDMSVSEWTEGLKKKEASLIYVTPSVGFADSSP